MRNRNRSRSAAGSGRQEQTQSSTKEEVAPQFFDRRADQHEYWQVSFHMSLQDAVRVF